MDRYEDKCSKSGIQPLRVTLLLLPYIQILAWWFVIVVLLQSTTWALLVNSG